MNSFLLIYCINIFSNEEQRSRPEKLQENLWIRLLRLNLVRIRHFQDFFLTGSATLKKSWDFWRPSPTLYSQYLSVFFILFQIRARRYFLFVSGKSILISFWMNFQEFVPAMRIMSLYEESQRVLRNIFTFIERRFASGSWIRVRIVWIRVRPGNCTKIFLSDLTYVLAVYVAVRMELTESWRVFSNKYCVF